MLHKSKSKKINLIKYALVIPLLAIFLMSFNTEDIYIETPILDPENDTTITHEVLTKNDIEKISIYNNFTDAKFKTFKAKLSSKGYVFNLKNIQRNAHNLITTIDFVISKNGVEGKYRRASGIPLKTVVIEYSKIKNKFSINTLDFIEDQKKYTNNLDVVEIMIDKNTTVASLVKKKKLLKEKYNITFNFKIIEQDSENEITIYSYEIGKKGSLHKVQTASDTPMVFRYNSITNSVSHHSINKNGDPTYESVQYLDKQNSYVILSDYNDKNLEKTIEHLKKKGITAKFSNIKRNNKGRIISIEINAKSKYTNSNYNQSSEEPIAPIAITYFGKGTGIKIETSTFRRKVLVLEEKNNRNPNLIKKKITESKDKEPLYIICDEEVKKEDFEKLSHDETESLNFF